MRWTMFLRRNRWFVAEGWYDCWTLVKTEKLV